MFGRPRRTATPPPGVELGRGERVLASDVTTDGAPIVATNHRVLLPTPDGLASISWANVDRATFDRESGLLTVIETAMAGGRPRRHRLRVDGALTLLDVIREQVKASVILTRHVPIADGKGARISGRRRPDTGALTWNVTVDVGLDVDDPDVRRLIDAALAAVRAELP
ncbi:MAG TPA: hypothetical protein VFZ37_18185 [Jiangellaceae bacterium]